MYFEGRMMSGGRILALRISVLLIKKKHVVWVISRPVAKSGFKTESIVLNNALGLLGILWDQRNIWSLQL